MRSATDRRSPETIATWRTPSARRRSTMLVGVGAQLVGHHDHAGELAVDRRPARAPRRSRGRDERRAGDLVRVVALARRKARLPTATRCPSTVPAIPWPGSSRTSCGIASSSSASSAARTSASPSTCADRRSTDAASRSTSPGVDAASSDDLADVGRADGQRAGLVEQHGPRLAERLDRAGALDDHAAARGAREARTPARSARRGSAGTASRRPRRPAPRTGSPLTAHASAGDAASVTGRKMPA